jgi:hypothetical protein
VEEEIKLYVDDRTFQKYKKFKLAQIRLNNPNKNYINCPIPDCEEIIETDPNHAGAAEDTFLQCLEGHKFCSRCKSPQWHVGGKCQNVINK